MEAAKKKGIHEAERWRRRVVAKEATNSQKLAKPDLLEKTKIVSYKESKYFVREWNLLRLSWALPLHQFRHQFPLPARYHILLLFLQIAEIEFGALARSDAAEGGAFAQVNDTVAVSEDRHLGLKYLSIITGQWYIQKESVKSTTIMSESKKKGGKDKKGKQIPPLIYLKVFGPTVFAAVAPLLPDHGFLVFLLLISWKKKQILLTLIATMVLLPPK